MTAAVEVVEPLPDPWGESSGALWRGRRLADDPLGGYDPAGSDERIVEAMRTRSYAGTVRGYRRGYADTARARFYADPVRGAAVLLAAAGNCRAICALAELDADIYGDALVAAAAAGNIETAKKMHQLSAKKRRALRFGYCDAACIRAAGCGQGRVLGWLLSLSPGWGHHLRHLISSAARGGHIECLEVLLRAGSWPDDSPGRIALDAALHGHVAILEWVAERWAGDIDWQHIRAEAGPDHPHIIEWLDTTGR